MWHQSARRFVTERSKIVEEYDLHVTITFIGLSYIGMNTKAVRFDALAKRVAYPSKSDKGELYMSKRHFGLAALLLFSVTGLSALPVARAHAADATVDCDLRFSVKGWSILYKHAEGQGTIVCNNGQRANVKINVVGGGLTAGKYRIDDGKGAISHVRSIDDVFGDYAQAGADAGVVKSGSAEVLTKGTTSLALSGTGEGVNLGVSVGKFTIERVH
jgi:hypothetical protein